MTAIELKFILYLTTTLLSIIAFVGVIFVKSFLKMAEDINEIKTDVKVASSKHDSLEFRVETLERRSK